MSITRYGRSVKAGGWDTYGDSDTDQGLGNNGNTLSFHACAITQSAKIALGIQGKGDGTLLKIQFADGSHQYRVIEDTAPEDNMRVDLLYYWIDDPSIPDTADVTVVP